MNKRCSCVVLKENVSVVHYNSGRGKTGRCALYFRTEGVAFFLLLLLFLFYYCETINFVVGSFVLESSMPIARAEMSGPPWRGQQLQHFIIAIDNYFV